MDLELLGPSSIVYTKPTIPTKNFTAIFRITVLQSVLTPLPPNCWMQSNCFADLWSVETLYYGTGVKTKLGDCLWVMRRVRFSSDLWALLYRIVL